MSEKSREPDQYEKTLFARAVRRTIGIVSGILAVLFALVQTSDIAIEDIVNPKASSVIWRIALIIYYASLTTGLWFDTNIQELAYASVPNRGKMPWHSVAVVALFGAGFAALLWTRGKIQAFSIMLAGFALIDHVAWRYLIWIIRPAIVKSEAIYMSRNDLFAAEGLKLVVHQIYGGWKLLRMCGIMLPLIVLMVAFSFVEPVRRGLAHALISYQSSLSTDDATMVIASALVLIYVLATEIPIWVSRIKTKISLDVLARLGDRYRLVRL
jgi:hypothetical protein